MTAFSEGLPPVGRAPFTLTTLALIAAMAAVTVTLVVLRLGWPGFLVLFCPLPVGWLIAVARRLRDMGRSEWWLLVPMLGAPAVTVVVSMVAMVVMAEAGWDDLAPVVFGFMVGLACGVAVSLAFTIWLAIAPSAPARQR